VTVTDERATRFFMTIPEASSLVLEAGAMAERGETYVLDMGQPVRILDLVRRYLKAVDRSETPIVFTGLRPGEKLHEVLTDEAESSVPTAHPSISRMESETDLQEDILVRAESMYAWCGTGDDEALVGALRALLPHKAVVSEAPTVAAGTVPPPRRWHDNVAANVHEISVPA
jgi:FlaA1/EpsC-like NDP-sugar epimerase